MSDDLSWLQIFFPLTQANIFEENFTRLQFFSFLSKVSMVLE